GIVIFIGSYHSCPVYQYAPAVNKWYFVKVVRSLYTGSIFPEVVMYIKVAAGKSSSSITAGIVIYVVIVYIQPFKFVDGRLNRIGRRHGSTGITGSYRIEVAGYFQLVLLLLGIDKWRCIGGVKIDDIIPLTVYTPFQNNVFRYIL